MASETALFCLLLLLVCLFKLHITFLEGFNNSHKFWGMDGLPKYGLWITKCIISIKSCSYCFFLTSSM